MTDPYFSIITPTYNRANLIGKTIESVLSQKFENFEYIIVDDGSTDQTESVVAAYQDFRIKYLKIQNGERGAARNAGAGLAKGNYLNFFDSDDIMYPNHLLLANEKIEESKYPDALCFSYDFLNVNGKVMNTGKGFTPQLNEKIFQDNLIHLNGTFIRKEVFDKILFINDRKFKIFEDWHFLYRLSLQSNVIGINETTSGYYIHEGSSMSDIEEESLLIALSYFDQLAQSNARLDKYKRYYEYEIYSMLSLALAIKKRRIEALKYMMTFINHFPMDIFKKRTLGIIKNLLV